MQMNLLPHPEPIYLLSSTSNISFGHESFSQYPQNQFTFIVYILIYLSESDIFRCTGSLVKSHWVLTSAHCLSFERITPADLMVVANKGVDLNLYLLHRLVTPFEWNLDPYISQERRVAYFRIHPSFDKNKSKHAVALLKLKEQFQLAINYAVPSIEKMTEKRENCSVIGYGLMNTKYDRFDAKIGELSNLTVSTPEIGCLIKKKKGPYLCVIIAGNSTCPGDFGVPLICDGKIWGLASKYKTDRRRINDGRCSGQDEFYYDEVYADTPWIELLINKSSTWLERKQKWCLFYVGFLWALKASF